MKKNILSFLRLIILLSIVSSCTDTRLDNIPESTIYISQSGEIEQLIYKTGEPFVFRLGVYKAGYTDISGSATVNSLTDAELKEYNNQHNTKYKRLPDNCFQLKNQSLNFSEKDRLQYADIIIDYKAIEALPDFDETNSAQYVIPMQIVKASIKENSEKTISLVKPVIKDAFVYFSTPASKIVMEASDKPEYKQNLTLAVDFPNTWDISIDLSVAPEALKTYNEEHHVNYALLPNNAYTIAPNPLTIAKGANAVESVITFHYDKIDYDDFLLPVIISKTSKFVPDVQKQIHYVHVSKPAERLDRTLWSIADISSEEAAGEGAGNGVGKCVLDDNPSTFWHSQWAGGTGELPHSIVIDMKKELLVTSVDLQRRPNQSDTKAGNFYISSDNKNFVKIGSFDMALVNEAQTFKVTSTRGRYLKVEITGSRRPPFANMGEIYVRGTK